MSEFDDCLIVGAGPAGLAAALYMARFCRRTRVLHDGRSRASRIPRTHNVPGFAEGITGPELIAQMSRHAKNFGAQIEHACITDARRIPRGFELRAETGDRWQGRSLILATGVELEELALDPAMHEAAITAGVLRYCPICDGFEHRGRRIGVVGCNAQGAAEALFLRQFSDRVTLIPRACTELTLREREALEHARVRVVGYPVTAYRPESQVFRVELAGDDQELEFDVVYPALGVRPRNQLAQCLGLSVDDDGAVAADAPFGTRIAGLFVIGDLIEGLDQISVAIGHGAVAATRAHNYLRSVTPDS